MGNGINTRRRRRVETVALSAAVLLTGAVYALTRTQNERGSLTPLSTDERWRILQTALRLKHEPIDWESIVDEDTHQFAGATHQQSRRLQSVSVPIPDYEYSRGNCPNEGSQGVPCSPDDLARNCNKRTGRFSQCLIDCAPSYCCIHDAPGSTNPFAPSCRDDENCAQYTQCYIAWWKLQDMVGPATELQLQQNDDFFDVDVLQDVIMDPLFFQQLLFHHFEDIAPILELLGTAESVQEVFAMPEIWDANSAISGNPPGGA